MIEIEGKKYSVCCIDYYIIIYIYCDIKLVYLKKVTVQ